MIDVLNLALPFFGLIFVGFACGRIKQIPDTALGWMNFFIVYVSLPALFYRILAQTPLEQLARVDFILATTLATSAPSRSRSASAWRSARATSPSPRSPDCRRLRQYRLHGSGTGACDARAGRRRAGRADLLLRQHRPVHAGAVPMALARPKPMSVPAIALRSVRRVAGASADRRQRARRRVRVGAFPTARRARPADAIPAERRRALRAVRARRHGRAAAVESDAVGDARTSAR